MLVLLMVLMRVQGVTVRKADRDRMFVMLYMVLVRSVMVVVMVALEWW